MMSCIISIYKSVMLILNQNMTHRYGETSMLEPILKSLHRKRVVLRSLVRSFKCYVQEFLTQVNRLIKM